MSRIAKEIDRQRLNRIKKMLNNERYIQVAVQIIAHKLTNKIFEEIGQN